MFKPGVVYNKGWFFNAHAGKKISRRNFEINFLFLFFLSFFFFSDKKD